MKTLTRIVLALAVMTSILHAQHPGYLNGNNETGIPDYGTFIHTNLDSINLQNGGVNIRLPLLTRKMRGFDLTVGFRYDSKFWIIDKVMQNNGSTGNQLWGVWKTDESSGWQKSANLGGYVEWNETEVYCPAIYQDQDCSGGSGDPEWPDLGGGGSCSVQTNPPGYMMIRHSYVLKSGDGSKVTFPTRKIHEVSTPPNSCQDYQNSLSTINNFTGHSISGHTLLDISDDHLSTGVSYKLQFKDGSWQIQNAILHDSNGNVAGGTGDGSGWNFDNLGRPIYKWSGPGSNETLSYYDSNGTLQNVLIQYTAGPVLPSNQPPVFPTSFPFYQPQWQPGASGPSEIWVTLPGNLVYKFSTADPDNPNQLNPFGEISKITLPNGGYIKYKYATIAQRDALEPDLSGMYTAQPTVLDARVLVEKRISDSAGPERIWSYSYSQGTDGNGFYQITTVTDPENNVEIHTFRGDPAARMRESAVEYRQGAGVALKKIETNWAFDTGAVSAGMPVAQYGGYSDGFQMGHRNDRVVGTTTTLLDISPTLSSNTETYFTDCFQYTLPVAYMGSFTYTDCRENPTVVREYDYGMALKRHTEMTYVHQDDASYADAHIWDKLRDQRTYDGSGTSNLIAREYFWFDQSAPVATSGVPNHDAVTGPRGNQTHAFRFRIEDSTWLATVSAFNDVGNVTSITDPGGHTTYFDYTDNFTDSENRNSQGFLTRVDLPTTNGVQHVERKQYFWYTGLTAAECGQNYPLASGCSWNGNNPTHPDHFAFSFDALNRPLTVKNGGGGWRTFQYFTDHARMEKGAAAGTYAESVYWDGLGRVTQKQVNSASPYPILQDTYYDAGGKVWKQSAPYYSNDPSKGYITRTEYDALGRVIRVTTEADGNYTTTTYTGKRTTTIDQTGRTRVFDNDAFGNLEAVGEPHETTGVITYWTYYKYDALGRLLCVEQHGSASSSSVNCGNPNDGVFGGDWRVRKFKYSSLGQLLESRNPEAGVNTFTYDNEGNLTTKADARGITTTFAYDELHRVVSKSFPNSALTPGVSFTYDTATNWGVTSLHPIGRLTMALTGGGTTWNIYSYDNLGRTTTQWSTKQPGGTGSHVTDAAYNIDGSVAWLNYPSGRKLAFSYDLASRLKQVSLTEFNGPVAQYNYWTVPVTVGSEPGFHPSGALHYEDLGNTVRQTTNLNSRLQPSQLVVAGPAQHMNKLYQYYDASNHNNGNILNIDDWKAGFYDASRSQFFRYDQLNRIQQAAEGPIGNTGTGRWGQAYTIDPWGNLTFIDNVKGQNTEYSSAANPDNNLSTNTRDAAGNTTADGNHIYVWDAESRLAALDGGSAAYDYDANGMRVRKQTGTGANAIWTEYVYFGGNVIAEKDQSGTWTDYIFAGGKRIAKAPGVASISGTQYYHADHLGTARLMTDASGNVVAGSESTTLPYGEEYSATPNVSGNHYVFTGKERDAESGLDYFGARYYRSTSGRWLTPDWSDAPTPVPYADFSDPQTLNLYGYVGNRPITNADADGHCCPSPSDNADFKDVVIGGSKGLVIMAAGTWNLAAEHLNAGGQLSGQSYLEMPTVPTPTYDNPAQVISGGLAQLGVVVYSAFKGLTSTSSTAEATVTQNAAKGAASEARVLKEIGAAKNTRAVSASEGNSIPDFVNERVIGEIKDAKTVTNTRQIRIQKEAAKESGREHELITGTRTKVTKSAAQGSKVTRREDLGPK